MRIDKKSFEINDIFLKDYVEDDRTLGSSSTLIKCCNYVIDIRFSNKERKSGVIHVSCGEKSSCDKNVAIHFTEGKGISVIESFCDYEMNQADKCIGVELKEE